MGEVVEFKPRRAIPDNCFGGCPYCGENNGFLNIGRGHWFFCDQHKTTWLFGSNIFSSWREEDEETWQQNDLKLSQYITVEPIFPEPTQQEREQEQEREYEQTVTTALGATMVSNAPINPSDLLEMHDPFEPRPDRLYILTSDRVAYDLERAAAYAAFEAHKTGDVEAIAHLLGRAKRSA